jgi:regulator of replication initiation timing
LRNFGAECRKPTEILELGDKIQRLESELNGAYKENQQNTTQIMELMRKVKELELENKDLNAKLQANIDYNNKNALILEDKVMYHMNCSLKR